VVVIERSASGAAPTVTTAVAVLLFWFESGVADATVAVFVMTDPEAAVWSTRTTIAKTADAPLASDGAVHVIWPVAPGPGVGQDHPEGAEVDRKVVPSGTASSSVVVDAAAGPAFETVIE
jgi:hypothetical protein